MTLQDACKKCVDSDYKLYYIRISHWPENILARVIHFNIHSCSTSINIKSKGEDSTSRKVNLTLVQCGEDCCDTFLVNYWSPSIAELCSLDWVVSDHQTRSFV